MQTITARASVSRQAPRSSMSAMHRISRWRRLLGLAATTFLFAPLSVEAGPVALQNLTYTILVEGLKGTPALGYGLTAFYNNPTTTPQPTMTPPVPLSSFIWGSSDPGTTVDPGSSYSAQATRIRQQTPTGLQNTNETLSQVTATVQLNAFKKLGFFPQPGFLRMDMDADTRYQVMVVNTHFAPSDVKGVPVIGTTAGKTQCSGAAIAEADIFVDFNLFARAQCPTTNNPFDDHFDKVATGTFPVGVPVNVDVSAFGSVNLQVGLNAGANSDKGFFFASADPSFEIDPSFPFANDFALVFSPGFDAPLPSPDVPEPGSLLLLAVGASLTLGMRRRQGNTRKQAANNNNCTAHATYVNVASTPPSRRVPA
jgi:hypothetical protein